MSSSQDDRMRLSGIVRIIIKSVKMNKIHPELQTLMYFTKK